MVLGLAALLLFPPKLDVELRATSVRSALLQISKQSGEKLTAHKSVAENIVFIHAREVEPDTLRQKLAEAIDAKWEKVNDELVLLRTPEIQARIYKDHLATRRRLITAELEIFKKQLAQPFDAKKLATGLQSLQAPNPNDEAGGMRFYERQRELIAQGPMARLLRRLMLACSLDDLAAIEPFTRSVFRAKPSAMQKGIDPAKFKSALKEFAEEQKAWIEVAAGMALPEAGALTVSEPRSQLDIPPTHEDFGLDVGRGEATGLLWVNLANLNPENPRRGALTQEALAGPARTFLNAQSNPVPVKADDPIVELSPESKAFSDRVSRVFFETSGPAPSTEILDLIQSPDEKDPLSMMVSDALTMYAKTDTKNIVASLPDSIFSWSSFISRDRPLRLRQFMKALVDSGEMLVAEKDGWSVLTQVDRYDQVPLFTPRTPMSDYMKSLVKTGSMDLRKYSEFAWRSRRTSRFGLSEIYISLFDRSLMSALDRVEWDQLRLYGSLTDKEKDVIENEGTISLTSLSPEQKALIDRIMYRKPIQSEVQAGGGVAGISSTPIEPTDAYPHGLPSSGLLTGATKSRRILYAFGKGPDGKVRPTRTVDPGTLAFVENEKVANPEILGRYSMPGLVGYGLGTEKIIRFRILLEPGVWTESALTINEVDKDATPVAWDKLPEPFITQIKAGFESDKQRRANSPPKTPPPSRS